MQLCMVNVYEPHSPDKLLVRGVYQLISSHNFFQLWYEFYECIYHHLESLRWPNVSLGEEVHSRNMAPWHVENGDPI